MLLIAAHGSSTDARARAQVLAHAARISALVPHDVTVTGFAKGEPSIRSALASVLPPGDHGQLRLTVVPFMTSAGYYARSVLPRLVDDALAACAASQVQVRVTRPVGASRRIVAVLHRRALRLAASRGWAPRDVVIVLAGHGTPRHPASRDTALAHARALRQRGWSAAHAAFIDDDPGIAAVVRALPTQRVIVLPFLIGGAAHHLVDVPTALGFDPGDVDADASSLMIVDAGRTLLLDAPLGTDDALTDIAAGLAAHAWQHQLRDAAPTRRLGSVHLVGAGPGAADLITVRGLRALRRADVVVHDRLVSDELLAAIAPAARLVDVGKQADTPQDVQSLITDILIAEARAGRRVVRLKGGDPFVFGRGSEEVAAGAAAGIRVRVTPGISSALAAPAAAGIPVTARHVARGFAVVTASTDSDHDESLAHLRPYAAVDTLVILMGRSRLRTLCALLIDAGRAPDTPVACIERATLPGERMVRGTLNTIADIADAAGLGAPMVTVLGPTAEYTRHMQRAASSRIANESARLSPR